MAEISDSIKELRKKHGLTQKELSDMTGMPKRTIESWEGGVRKCPEYVEKLLWFYIENKKSG